jgi:hypothetical protein
LGDRCALKKKDGRYIYVPCNHNLLYAVWRVQRKIVANNRSCLYDFQFCCGGALGPTFEQLYGALLLNDGELIRLLQNKKRLSLNDSPASNSRFPVIPSNRSKEQIFEEDNEACFAENKLYRRKVSNFPVIDQFFVQGALFVVDFVVVVLLLICC